MKLKITIALGFTIACFSAMAQQTNELSVDSLYNLSLEELMNIPINSASKKSETLFEAPLSSYTITRSDIDKAGPTSIVEALRLSPGVIVREQANGEYDVQLRGMDNLSRTNSPIFKTNTLTLVMIDNRPVFNHGLGGTYWESLPIDINDVDRIEIVRGPSSPLFGPNAVTGVINIITKRMSQSKTMVSANVQTGNFTPVIANASFGNKINDKFSYIVSANVQDRRKTTDLFYQSSTGNNVPLTTLVPNDSMRKLQYPHPNVALQKWGVNSYLNYKPTDKVSFDLSLARQGSTYQRYFVGDNMSTSGTTTTSANLAATVGSLKVRSSYTLGSITDIKGGVPNGQYDYHIGEVNGEYEFKLANKYSIVPGINYQSVNFNDGKYVKPDAGIIGYFNKSNTLTTTSGSLRSDLNFTRKLRVIAALRADKFSVPNKTYLAYELATTYKLNEKNLIRAAFTRSNSGSFLGYNFLNIAGQYVGNQNLKIFTLNMIEIGYRAQITKELQFDIDAFEQRAENLTAFLGSDPSGTIQFNNIPTTATQHGATFSFNFVPNDRFQFKPFVTMQKTITKDLPSMYVTPALGQLMGAPVTYSNSTHMYTPASYGGFYSNFRASAKFNVNMSGYYFSKQTAYDGSYDANNPSAKPAQYAAGQISGKFMINAKVSYEPVKGLFVFVNARNAFGSKSTEFYGGNPTQAMYLGGISYHLN